MRVIAKTSNIEMNKDQEGEDNTIEDPTHDGYSTVDGEPEGSRNMGDKKNCKHLI